MSTNTWISDYYQKIDKIYSHIRVVPDVSVSSNELLKNVNIQEILTGKFLSFCLEHKISTPAIYVENARTTLIVMMIFHLEQCLEDAPDGFDVRLAIPESIYDIESINISHEISKLHEFTKRKADINSKGYMIRIRDNRPGGLRPIRSRYAKVYPNGLIRIVIVKKDSEVSITDSYLNEDLLKQLTTFSRQYAKHYSEECIDAAHEYDGYYFNGFFMDCGFDVFGIPEPKYLHTEELFRDRSHFEIINTLMSLPII